MTLQINMQPNATVMGPTGLMTAAGNPWTVADAFAQELVNRGVATAFNWPSTLKTPAYVATDPLTGNATGIYGQVNGVPNQVIALGSSGVSLVAQLKTAMAEAKNANPFDLQALSAPKDGNGTALVTSVTIPTSTVSLTNPKTVSYMTTPGGYDMLRLDGVPYKDGTLGSNYVVGGNLTAINVSGNVMIQNYVGTAGAGFAGMGTIQNYWNNTIMRARVTIGPGNTNKCVILSGISGGFTSDYNPIWVNGVPVAPTSANITNNMLQINFAAAGTYDIATTLQLAIQGGNLIVDQDDCIIPYTKPRLPVVYLADSFGQGQTKAPSSGTSTTSLFGDLTVASAMSWIGGINVIPQAFSGTGIVCDGAGHIPSGYTAASFNYGDPRRLALVAEMARASGAPLIVVQGSYNDVTLSGNTSLIQQTQTAAIITYLLANTPATTNIVFTGAFSGSLGVDARITTVDNGTLAAVTAAASSRVGFIPVYGDAQPWFVGTKNTSTSTGVAGNARLYTGYDGVHPSGLLTLNQNIPANTVASSGIEYIARKLLDGIVKLATAKGW